MTRARTPHGERGHARRKTTARSMKGSDAAKLQTEHGEALYRHNCYGNGLYHYCVIHQFRSLRLEPQLSCV